MSMCMILVCSLVWVSSMLSCIVCWSEAGGAGAGLTDRWLWADLWRTSLQCIISLTLILLIIICIIITVRGHSNPQPLTNTHMLHEYTQAHIQVLVLTEAAASVSDIDDNTRHSLQNKSHDLGPNVIKELNVSPVLLLHPLNLFFFAPCLYLLLLSTCLSVLGLCLIKVVCFKSYCT